MALHRDIFWVGRQWAVTGYGLQAVDQKQKSRFDIEISRLWADDLTHELAAERWFNAEDFSRGLSMARARFPSAGETGGAQPFVPQAEPEPEEALHVSAPRREPLSPVREMASVASPGALPKPNLPKPDLPKPDLPERDPAKPRAIPAEPSHDTWASLAELARTAASTSPRKAAPPQPVASMSGVFAAPAKSPPRFDAPKPAAVMVEPPTRTCPPFDMCIESSGAKFSRMWRVRIRR
jgi:hypothetical protein